MANKFENSTHRCLGSGCKEFVAKSKLMCPYHWGMLPKELQDKVYDTFRDRNRSLEGPSNHRAAMLEAVSFVMKHEKGLKEQESLIANWEPNPRFTDGLEVNPALSQIEPYAMTKAIINIYRGFKQPKTRLLLTTGIGQAVDMTFDPYYLESLKSVEEKAEAVSRAAYEIAIKFFTELEGAAKNEF